MGDIILIVSALLVFAFIVGVITSMALEIVDEMLTDFCEYRNRNKGKDT